MVIHLDRKELKAMNIYFVIEFQIVCLVMTIQGNEICISKFNQFRYHFYGTLTIVKSELSMIKYI